MKILLILISLVSFNVFAQETPAVESGRGCLINMNNKSLGIDPTCNCLKRKACFKFKPIKQSDALLEVKEKNGKAVYSQNFKNKSRESAAVFSQIMTLKAQGKGSSPEIKDLYVKLDKLNTEVRKNLLATHGKYFSQIKSKYQKQLAETKVREGKLKERIEKYLSNPKSQTDAIKSSLAAAPAAPAADNAVKQEAVVTKPADNQIAKSSGSNASYNSEILEREKAKEMNKLLDRMDLERKDEDSLFDILSKRYLKTYPNLIDD